MRSSYEPWVHAHLYKITTPHFEYEEGDLIEVFKGFPEPGQRVLIRHHGCVQVAIYRKRYIELHDGTQLIGDTKKILGIVVLI